MITFNYFEKIHAKISREAKTDTLFDLNSKNSEKRIDDLVLGEGIQRKLVLEIMENLSTQYIFTNNAKYLEIYKIINYIFIHRNSNKEFTSNNTNIENAYKIAYFHTKNNSFYLDPPPNQKAENLKKSISFLRERNIKIKLKNGIVDKKNLISIEKIIDKKFEKLGFFSIDGILQILPKHDNSEIYKFSDSAPTTLYPWGFIFNKALKNLTLPKIRKELIADELLDLMKLSNHYISLFELQNYEYAQIQYMYADLNKTIKLIEKQVLCDQLLKIEQYDTKSIFLFIEFIKDKFNNEKINIIYNLAKMVYKNKFNKVFNASKFFQNLKNELPSELYEYIYKLVINTKPNKDFININFIEKIDYFKKPFILTNDGNIVFLNHSFFFVGFYHVILEELFRNNIKSIEQGKLIEDFAEYHLENNNINFIKGEKKYKVNKQQQSLLKIKSQELESDMITYNKENICFFELKLRTLVNKSKGGNVFHILNDLSESLLKSQTQLNKHKRYILNFNEINFRSNEKIKLDNREIYKISISSLDYQGLHNPLIFQILLRNIPGCVIDKTNDSNLNNLIDNINEKFKDFSNEILNKETKNEIISPTGLSNTFFLNVFQLLFLIDKSKEKRTDLIDELILTRNIRLDQFDFYYGYSYINMLKRHQKRP